ncbi:ABC transporter G family member 23 [Halotydeus destructor]|nr:ABC transporter G family member 23 [Halotydeus destructor]
MELTNGKMTSVNNNNGVDHSQSPRIQVTSSVETAFSDKTTPKAVCVRQLNLSYRNILSLRGTPGEVNYVLNGVNLDVPTGTIYGLLGPSGCGKTSLLRCVMGCLRPESGLVRVFGFKPGDRASGVPGPGVGYMPQDIALHNDLTIEEMLTYFGRIYFIDPSTLAARIDHLLAVLDLPEKTRLIINLSGGQKRRVSFASALIHKPRLLILDEPTVGVDPLLRDRIWRHLVKLTKEENATVIITTHYIEETRSADVVGFMRKGAVLSEDAPEKLMKRFNATGLEEVFYKLCTNQKRESKLITRKAMMTQQSTVLEDEYLTDQDRCPLPVPGRDDPVVKMAQPPESVIGQFILPIICLIMFCICIGGTPSNLPVAIVNQEDPPFLSEILLKHLNSYIITQVDYTDLDQALADVKAGKIWGVLHIKQNFSDAVTERVFFSEMDNATIDQSNVRLYADLTNKVLGITLDVVLTHTFEDFIGEAMVAMDYNPNLGKLPISLDQTVYGEFSKSDFFGVRDFAAPGFLIVITYSVSYALTALTLLLERLDQMFERNYASGISTTQIIVSILSTRFLFTSLGTTILLTMAIYLFDVPCRGPFWGGLLMLLLQSVAGMTNGMVISAIVPDFFICAAVSNGVLIFIFIISGVLWSLETLPYYVRWFSYIQPTTVPAESLRSLLTRGLGVTSSAVYPGYLISVTWIVIFFVVGVKIFKFQK